MSLPSLPPSLLGASLTELLLEGLGRAPPVHTKNRGTQGVQELFFCELTAPGCSSTQWTSLNK